MRERTELTSGSGSDTSQVSRLDSIPERLRSSTGISPQPIVSPELVSTTGHLGQDESILKRLAPQR